MKDQLTSIAIALAVALLPVLMTGLLKLGQKLHAYIDAKVKNEAVKGILDRLVDTSLVVVQGVEQSVVSKLDPTKPLGDNAVLARNAAMADLKTHLGEKGLNEMKSVLGIGDSALEAVLLSYIESAVHKVNTATPVGGAA